MADPRPDAFPARLALNAWDGGTDSVVAEVAPSSFAFARRELELDRRRFLAPDELADAWDWRDARVGWGVILPDVDQAKVSLVDQARAADRPELGPLLAARGDAPVFRYRKNHPATHLQRVLPDGSVRDIDIAGSPRGNARDALPMFLTIVAEPKDIPWGFQGLLSTRAAVGRLPLTGPELASYVDAMLNDWHEAPTPQREVVVWAVDFGKADITRLMLRAIADPLVAKYGKDNDIRLTHLDGSTETLDGEAATFIAAVTSQKPRLIVTTSHGATAPVDKPAQMQLTLGMPVDQRRRALVLADLLAGWEPDGVIWYAHACCGAGSSDLSDYVDLVQGDERVVSLLRGVSAIGESVAPLPMALLTAPKPARGFIGHVEPTFDWTIGSPLTGQHLTAALVNGLYDVLFQTQPMPLGFAMQEWYDGAATALGIWDEARKTLNKTGTATEDLLRSLLVARDRTGQVILGDPTVVLGPVHA